MDACSAAMVTEFQDFESGDARLDTRVVMIATDMMRNPEMSINRASKSRASSKAAYRFFNNELVTAEKLMQAHVSASLERIKSQDSKVVLAIMDTAYLNFDSHLAKKDMGVIGTRRERQSRGIIMHHTLGVSPRGEPLGFLERQFIYRPERENAGAERQKIKHKLPAEEKESYRWIESVHKTHEVLAPEYHPIFIGDREADAFDLMKTIVSLDNADFIFRMKEDRRAFEDESVDESLLASELLARSSNSAEMTISVTRISATNNRAGRAEREALCDVTWTKLGIQKNPDKKLKNLYAISVVERNPPKGCERIKWVLLTSLPISSASDALTAILYYKERWQIENLHRVLKDGTQIEECQLEAQQAIENYINLKAAIAFRLYALSRASRRDPERPATDYFKVEEINIICRLTQPPHKPLPKTTPTCREIIHRIAMRGGFLGRKGDGEPGMISVWRGWSEIMVIIEAVNILALNQQRSG